MTLPNVLPGVHAGMAMREIVQQAAEALDAAGVESPYNDARRLALWAARVERARFTIEGERIASDPGFVERLRAGVGRRARREPLQYIEGTAPFLDFEVEVGPGVLVPRPETELVALTAIGMARPRTRVLDCGTGAGAIAIAIARAVPGSEVHATERSQPALVYAARNIAVLASSVRLHQTWFLGAPGTFGLIVANPPYVGAGELTLLQPEVRDYEPRTALVPEDGDAMSDLRLIIRSATDRLEPDGTLVCEIGADQGPDVADWASECGYAGVAVGVDHAGRDRILTARRR